MHSKLNQIPLGRITELDGWRGISILMVIVGHLVNFRFIDYYKRSLCVLFTCVSVSKIFLQFGNWIDNSWAFACITCGALMAVNEVNLKQFILTIYPPAIMASSTILFLLPLMPNNYAFATLLKIATPIIVSALLLLSITAEHSFRAPLNSRPLQFVGRISYRLYVWQQLFLAPNFLYLRRPLFLAIPLSLLVVAALSYWVIEVPCTKLGKTLSNKK